jgi:aryl-alcohol dehydrogenase-like predicted oxidoreductase
LQWGEGIKTDRPNGFGRFDQTRSDRVSAERIELAPGYEVSRITKGNWQLAERHGDSVEKDQAIDDMRRFVEAGFTNFDCADHYVGVEELIGEFRKTHPSLAKVLTVQTKAVPDRDLLPKLKYADIEFLIDRALSRLGVERLDLVQFHWWDYDVPGYVEAMNWLKDMQAKGKIAHVGTTNFDCPRLEEIIASGVTVASNQLQYSVLDHRPEHGMAALAGKHSMALQCYGVIAGGFLSKRWLGAPEPDQPMANRSLVKYRLIIDEFGSWDLFQEVLRTLAAIGNKHGVSLSAVATRYVLDKPEVATAIVGARTADHLADLMAVSSLRLDAEDVAAIAAVTAKGSGPAGDCYGLERIPGGRHASIMWTNQNTKGVGAR